MSTDAVPIDAAWSVLQDGDRVEKIAFIPLALGAYGAYQGYKNVTNPRGPVVTDPITGGMLMEREVDRTPLGYGLAAGSGMLEATGLSAGAKLGAKGVGRFAGRYAGKKEAQRQAAKEAAEQSARQQYSRELMEPTYGPMTRLDTSRAVNHPYVQRRAREAGTEAFESGAKRQAFAEGTQRGATRLDQAMPFSLGAPLIAAGAGAMYPAAKKVVGGLAQKFFGGQEQAGADMSQMGAGGYGAGAGGYGQTGSYVQGNQDPYREQDIWQGTEWGKQYGMKTAGDNMKIGEQLLKQIQEQAHQENLTKGKCPKCDKEPCACDDKKKAVCDKCGKEGCVSKMGCVAKADKCPHCDGDAPRSACICGKKEKAEGSKKPAHGMVIVIGTKAGPGPSKDGKRQKLDSEKKDD